MSILNENEPAAEDCVTRFSHDFAVNQATAMEMIAWCANELGAGRMDDEMLRKLHARFRLGMQLLVSYQQNQVTPTELRMSTRALALALSFDTAAGAVDAADLGRKLGLQKQTVNKCLNQFIAKLDLPKRPGQRDEQAGKNMSAARIKQLKAGG